MRTKGKSKISSILLAVIVSILVVALSVAYYVVVFIPRREMAEIEFEKVKIEQQKQIDEFRTQSQGITSEEAVDIVQNREEVKEWLSLFTKFNRISPETGGRAVLSLDGLEDGFYIIHVFEDLPDHIATFGWYKVNSLTGEVVVE